MIDNKAYSLLSMMLILMIISSFLLLSLNMFKDFDGSHLIFINNYLAKQTDSLVNRKENYIDGTSNRFNENGHVAKAESIELGRHKVIIHLGNGYLTYE